ncbi:hypothetical protein R950_001109 [Salmonella enterica subsp. enterica]|nr:hypothetical protein [Salmonella enterica subsp. enterica serovar Baguida]EDW2259200.1 hypothetical protein [Salmonella enterica subsp. enterica serovar Langford]
MNVACDGPSGRGPWMGRVIRSQHISNLKYEGYKPPNINSKENNPTMNEFSITSQNILSATHNSHFARLFREIRPGIIYIVNSRGH